MGDLVDRNNKQDKKNLLACEDEADDWAKTACPEANGEELIGLSTRKPTFSKLKGKAELLNQEQHG